MKITYRILLFSLIFCCSSIASVFAQNFQTVSDITYKFDQQGIAHITNEISIVNQVDNLYVNEYSISLGDSQPKNISAQDQKGIIIPLITSQNNQTQVKLKLNDSVVGKGQINSFVFRYDSSAYAMQLGNNHEIRLPIAKQTDDYLGYKITIQVPEIYGRVSSASPNPDTVVSSKGYTIITYNKPPSDLTGIYLLFGDYQIYQVNWQVELSNNTADDLFHYFPLPPDTGYQKTFHQTIEPLPDEVKKDDDGNLIVYYLLNSGQNLSVSGATQVKVYPKSQYLETLNNKQLDKYLSSSEYWQSQDPLLINASKNLSSVEDIYNFVVNHLSYEYDGVNANRSRYGALYALQNPNKTVCSEYSDLFIALARNLGIPAREHEGFAFSSDNRLKNIYEENDVLHAWPEYYDRSLSKWIMVDPTFGDTSGGIDYLNNFDNSHITFVIHGLNDKQPVPIGAYKQENGISNKQINVIILSSTDLPASDNIAINLDSFTQSFNLLNQLTGLTGTKRFTQGPFISLIRQPIYFRLRNISGYPLSLSVQNDENVEITNYNSGIEILPWQNFDLAGYISPQEKFRRYYHQGKIIINGKIYNYTIPIISLVAMLFYLLTIFGILFFIYLLFKLQRSKFEDKTNL